MKTPLFFRQGKKNYSNIACPRRHQKLKRNVTESDEGDRFRFSHCNFTHTQIKTLQVANKNISCQNE